MARVILITGGNIGDVKPRLRKAQQLINERIGAIMRCSHVYASAAWGFDAAQEFQNQAMAVDTDLTPQELLREIQKIEVELGRNRADEAGERNVTGQAYSSRIIDIDILFYDDVLVDSAELTIPHPLLHEREFVLAPLCEIAPKLIHPVMGKTANELREELQNK